MFPRGSRLRGRTIPRSCRTGNVFPAGLNCYRPSRGLCRLLPPGRPGVRLLVFLIRRALNRGFHPFAGRRSVCGCFRRWRGSCRTGRTASPSAASGRNRGRPADGIAPRVGLPAVVQVAGKNGHSSILKNITFVTISRHILPNIRHQPVKISDVLLLPPMEKASGAVIASTARMT